MNPLINGRTDQGDNLPIHFSWSINPEAPNIKYKVSFREGDKVFYEEEVTKPEIDFINYKLNTDYIFKIEPFLGEKSLPIHDYVFSIPRARVRTITIDGMNNFRDLGDGETMKQGMIYRSCTFVNNTTVDEDHPTAISELGKKQLETLGLVSHIDLRKEDEKGKNEPVIVKKVFNTPLYYGGNNILTYKNSEYNNPETIKIIFTFLADSTNYPLDIHCVRGTDRTGCLAFLIKGLLGFEEEELFRDYLYSNFYNIGSPVKLDNILHKTNPNAITKYVNVLRQAEGMTLQEKIYNYLNSDKVGVSKTDLDKIINLLKA